MVISRRGLLGDFQFPGWEAPWVVRGPRMRSRDSVQGSLGFSICPIMWGRYALCRQEGQAGQGTSSVVFLINAFSSHHIEPPASRAPRPSPGQGQVPGCSSSPPWPCLAWLGGLGPAGSFGNCPAMSWGHPMPHRSCGKRMWQERVPSEWECL